MYIKTYTSILSRDSASITMMAFLSCHQQITPLMLSTPLKYC